MSKQKIYKFASALDQRLEAIEKEQEFQMKLTRIEKSLNRINRLMRELDDRALEE